MVPPSLLLLLLFLLLLPLLLLSNIEPRKRRSRLDRSAFGQRREEECALLSFIRTTRPVVRVKVTVVRTPRWSCARRRVGADVDAVVDVDADVDAVVDGDFVGVCVAVVAVVVVVVGCVDSDAAGGGGGDGAASSGCKSRNKIVRLLIFFF